MSNAEHKPETKAGVLANESVTLPSQQLFDWGTRVLENCGLPKEQIPIVLDALISCNLRGTDTHGIHMIQWYARRYKLFAANEIKIVAEGPAIARVDGGGNMGPVVGMFAMDLAVKKAKELGVGFVTVSNSSHFAATGYYPIHAANQGFIGFASSCGTALIAPWGGLKPIASNTPFAVSFPNKDFPIVLDMAVSVVARQKLNTYMREGWKLPDGWAMDKNGNPTSDAKEGYFGLLGAIGGYKGVGIAMMTEILIGCLNEAGFSTESTHNRVMTGHQHIGHQFLAINPDFIISPENRQAALDKFAERFHSVPLKEGVDKVYLPGELEWDIFQERSKTGIPLSSQVIKELNDFSDEMGVPHLA